MVAGSDDMNVTSSLKNLVLERIDDRVAFAYLLCKRGVPVE